MVIISFFLSISILLWNVRRNKKQQTDGHQDGAQTWNLASHPFLHTLIHTAAQTAYTIVKYIFMCVHCAAGCVYRRVRSKWSQQFLYICMLMRRKSLTVRHFLSAVVITRRPWFNKKKPKQICIFISVCDHRYFESVYKE